MSLKQRRKLLCLTAASGSVPNLEVAVAATGCLPTLETFEAAAAAGSLASCQWLHQEGYPLGYYGTQSGGRVLAAAAGRGHTHVCEWLCTLNLTWFWGAEEAAAKSGHLHIMDWLIQRRPQLRFLGERNESTNMALLAAAVASGCDLPTMQSLWPRWGELQEDRKEQVLAAAAGSPTPDWAAKVEWLEGQGCPRTEDASTSAATCADALDRLRWLRSRGYPLGAHAVELAAESGNTAALLYLLAEGVRPQPGSEIIAQYAAGGGHWPALQALHAAAWPMDAARAACAAARGGYLQVVAWLVEALGAALGAELFAAAAQSGSVELMAWLRQRGCEWDAGAFDSAAKSGCEEALEWLVAQGCPMPANGKPYLTVCQEGDPATARCLRRLGLPWGDPAALFLDAAKSRVAPRMLRWLLEAGCCVDYDAAEAAVAEEARRLPFVAAYAAEVADALRQHKQSQERQGMA